MAGERRLNWGTDPTDAQYASGDDDPNNRFIVAEDLDGGTVLLEYDETAGEWVYRGPVNMDGNDVTNVGALDATSVSTDALGVGGQSDINYWPPVYIDDVDELISSSPATSYTTVALSGPPSDATHAYIRVDMSGDGTADSGKVELREGGSSRTHDLEGRLWAGNGDFTEVDEGFVPTNSNNEIEYRTTNLSDCFIRTIGYF